MILWKQIVTISEAAVHMPYFTFGELWKFANNVSFFLF